MVDVYLWLYHTDLWSEFYDILNPIRDNIVLHLGLCNEKDNNSIIQSAISSFSGCKISYHDNAGGDILPFISDFVSNTNKQDLFIKIHSKRSTLLKTVKWRDILLHSLIGIDGQNFYTNCCYMKKYKKTGLMTNNNLLFSNQENSNTNKINELLQYFHIDKVLLKKKLFPAGTMFLGRTSLYDQYFNKNSIDHLTQLLKKETGHVIDIIDGKYCHSIERLFGYICEYEKYKIIPCKYNTIKIINSKAPHKKFHMSITNNNFVFMEESLAIHGTMLCKTNDSITIEWYHLKNPVCKKYFKLNQNTYIQSND